MFFFMCLWETHGSDHSDGADHSDRSDRSDGSDKSDESDEVLTMMGILLFLSFGFYCGGVDNISVAVEEC